MNITDSLVHQNYSYLLEIALERDVVYWGVSFRPKHISLDV